jgi:GH15 family glucan-1,4-alpha-glucosidase
MPHFRGTKSAFGAPGDEPRWTGAAKDGVGTAHSFGGRVWYTIGRGILTEVYYPTVDRPQLRDLEFLFSDEKGLFLEEKQDLGYQIERMAPSQGYRITRRDPGGRFSFTKEVIAEPTRPCVLIHTVMEGNSDFLRSLKTYVMCNPHLEVGGAGNNAYVVEVSGRQLLVAEKEDRWLVMGASCPFARLSCGYLGSSDGYTDLKKNGRMSFEFDEAKNGNVALTAELDLSGTHEFTIGIAFGESLPSAVSSLFQSLGVAYNEQRKVFIHQWEEAAKSRLSLNGASGDQGRLFESSYNLLLTHEDKLYQGAFVASLAIPWGEARDDKSGKGGQPPNAPPSYPAREIVDGGFLQLVRYGILPASDPLIVDSLRVVDAVLKTETPAGPCWHRYNHDGYGQKPGGGPYTSWGQGRAWPLLTGERGHYELAAGRDCRPFLHAMEKLSNATCLLPEQVWDEEDIPDAQMRRGGPTGSANPLLWAHSEYVRLLRSSQDGKVFDAIPEVLARYKNGQPQTKVEYWLPMHPIRQARKDHTLRICATEAFRLRWTADGWKTSRDSDSRATGIGGEYFDLSPNDFQSQIDFTFFWPNRNQWEGQNHDVKVVLGNQEKV